MTTPALHIDRLTFRYSRTTDAGAEPWTLSVPAYELAPGEQALLVARSGQGKSTLLSLIAGLMEPASGRILVNGQDVHALRGPARDQFRGRTIGMIFQTFNLLQGFSAVENILAAMMLAGAQVDAARAASLLDSLDMRRHHAPVETLSIGQQQRVAVARALACGPALVLADEPTASLDPENAAAAIDLIRGACRDSGAALLCVSHDPAMPQRFDRADRMTDGLLAQPSLGASA
ncbi:MAG: ATP-binding cassette domain-containing protein [Phycisphaeraceae bacterium]|nr:ATP-binding cassette domain-containing protein [Phycisphaeraceae bacterium]